jgi:hypothetical protein
MDALENIDQSENTDRETKGRSRMTGVDAGPIGPRWAMFASGILHPFTIPPIVFLLLYLAATDPTMADSGRLLVGLSVAIVFASALPLAAVVYMARRGMIESIDISDRTKRTVPLLLAVGSYAAGFVVLMLLGAPDLVRGLMLAYAVNTAVVAMITLWWKISIHAVGLAGPLAALTIGLGLWVLTAYVLLIILAVARVELRRHTPAQVVSGALLGLAATTVQLSLFVPIF